MFMAVQRYVAAVTALVIAGSLAWVALWPVRAAGTGAAASASSAPASAASTQETPADILAKNGPDGLRAAVKQYRYAIERNPDQLAICNDLGQAYLLLGQKTEAQAILTDALARCTSALEKNGNRPEDAQTAVHLRTTLANVMLAKGDLARAQNLLEEAVKLTPRDTAAHSDLATTLFLQGKFDAAAPHYDLANALQPGNAEILANWATMLLQADHLSEAEAKFRKAIAINKNQPKYYYGLGRVLRKEKRFGAALKAEEAALDINPRMLEALLETAGIYVELKQYRPAEANLRAALIVDRDNLEATVNLAHVLLGTDDPQQRNALDAALLLRKATELTHEKDVNLLTQLADALALAEYYDEAGQTLHKVLALAREKHLSGAETELLMAHGQQYVFLQNKNKPREGVGSPLSAVGAERFLPTPQQASPLDVPEKAPTQLPEPRIMTPP
jgi:tetratricopeptide (TPR) repeat protein